MNRALPSCVVLIVLTLFACREASADNAVSTLTSPSVTNDLAERRYQGIPLPLTDENKQVGAPPPAWLVFNEQAFPGRNAAFQTLQTHVDPAEAFPDLASIITPAQTEFLIIIASNSVTEFRASVVQWDPQANPLPLVEAQGQLVTYTMREEDKLTIFTLKAVYPFQEQFLHVYIAFSQPSTDIKGYAHYLWRITTGT